MASDEVEEREPTARLEMPRRIVDVPVASSGQANGETGGSVSRVAVGTDLGPVLLGHQTQQRSEAGGTRQLAVGPGICVEGTIKGCERLVIEGELKAALEATEYVVVGQGGRFDGRGEVDGAEIAGVFEGTLVVRGRLLIRASGRVRGDIRFGELEIERGGQLVGNVDVQSKAPQLAEVATAVAGGD